MKSRGVLVDRTGIFPVGLDVAAVWEMADMGCRVVRDLVGCTAPDDIACDSGCRAPEEIGCDPEAGCDPDCRAPEDTGCGPEPGCDPD